MDRNLLHLARTSGMCPPILLSDEAAACVNLNDGFEADLLNLLDVHGGFYLGFESHHGDGFFSLSEKAHNLNVVSNEFLRKNILVYRRCVLLAIAGNTPKTHPSIMRAISVGFLNCVKFWLDQILDGSVGGVDLLLHLLSNIAVLPVTKDVVKNSGMGKVIGSIEKHRLCAGTPNESAIKERVQTVKDFWHASVKSLKSHVADIEFKAIPKRPLEIPFPSPLSAKKTKVNDDPKKLSSSLSTLLKKVSSINGVSEPRSVSVSGNEGLSKNEASESNADPKTTSTVKNGVVKQLTKKTMKRVKWADHFGSALTSSKVIENGDTSEAPSAVEATVNWSDRKKRDRMREKELLANAKKSKLLDEEDGENELSLTKYVLPTMSWRLPSLLPQRPEVTKAVLNSAELSVQKERIKAINPVTYRAEYEIPSNPISLTDVEQALDMTSQSAAIVGEVPFFVPAQPAPAAEPQVTIPDPVSYAAALVPTGQATAATPEFVQALGLPMFLVGQDTQALQTLASSPSLLSTLVDAHGMYDQARLMSLVQTLSATSGHQPLQAAPSMYGSQQSTPGLYGLSSLITPYGHSSASFTVPPARNGFRNNNAEGNLHISGFGPTTTQAEIVALFSPYVQVDEVVMKGTFAFVNTSDPPNAQRAREALNGTLFGGMPVRINPAQRKNREAVGQSTTLIAPSKPPPIFAPPPIPAPVAPITPMPSVPAAAINVDAVRDDRGNPATKNLFVAGYGPGTTEQNIRELFSQHAHVIGVVLKGSFTFVNTSERSDAVNARENLSNVMVNGGALRINFAKETGRLGTSFDLTYGPNTGPNANLLPNPTRLPPPAPTGMSYYGRG